MAASSVPQQNGHKHYLKNQYLYNICGTQQTSNTFLYALPYFRKYQYIFEYESNKAVGSNPGQVKPMTYKFMLVAS